jgi:hypothetical protein
MFSQITCKLAHELNAFIKKVNWLKWHTLRMAFFALWHVANFPGMISNFYIAYM